MSRRTAVRRRGNQSGAAGVSPPQGGAHTGGRSPPVSVARPALGVRRKAERL
ncbi:MAG: hypothetical protein AB1522_14960 [Chloroflexota bacterium]